MELVKIFAYITANWDTITLIITNIAALFVNPPKLNFLRGNKNV